MYYLFKIYFQDFRVVQNVVKINKRKFDILKEDIAVKVDTLKTARINLFDELLHDYKSVLFKFYEKTADEFTACTEEMAGLESYEIDVLKVFYYNFKNKLKLIFRF
jgi:hypothetical protein